MLETKEEMATKIDVADWFSLRAHLERGGVILVDSRLDLAEVGAKVAADDVPVIEAWILDKMLGKPSAEQISTWDRETTKVFNCLIVSPYVLIQEPPLH